MPPRKRRPPTPYHVKLACGCTIKSRTPPATDQVTYCCASGQQHGYTIRWESWQCEGQGEVRLNRSLGEKNE